MSYLSGNLETDSAGSKPFLGAVTVVFPGLDAFRNLFPHVNPPASPADIPAAASQAGMTEEQMRQFLLTNQPPPPKGFMDSLPPWALPVAGVALVGGFLLMRKKG